jgi:hypothetical protein
MVPAEIADEYDLTPEQVTDALTFYEAHRGEIEASLTDEQTSESVAPLHRIVLQSAPQ